MMFGEHEERFSFPGEKPKQERPLFFSYSTASGHTILMKYTTQTMATARERILAMFQNEDMNLNTDDITNMMRLVDESVVSGKKS